VVRRGDPDAGTVLVKLNRFEAGVTRLHPGEPRSTTNRPGAAAPEPAPVAEGRCRRPISPRQGPRAIPDLWVLEIEDRKGAVISWMGRIV